MALCWVLAVTQAFLESCGERGCSPAAAPGPSRPAASLAENTGSGRARPGSCAPASGRRSVLVACGLGCSEACGILPDQGLNPCLLHHRQANFTTDPGEALRVSSSRFHISLKLFVQYFPFWEVISVFFLSLISLTQPLSV